MTPIKNAKGFSPSTSRTVLTLLIFCFCSIIPSSAAPPPATNASVLIFPRLVKARVQALGLGAMVKVSTMFHRRHYRGYITRIDEDSFELTDIATLTPRTFTYTLVSQVTGRQLSDPTDHKKGGRVTSLFSTVSRLGFGP
jgi:hypothetical protein